MDERSKTIVHMRLLMLALVLSGSGPDEIILLIFRISFMIPKKVMNKLLTMQMISGNSSMFIYLVNI